MPSATITRRDQAARAASSELRKLVGIPWTLGGLDPRPAASGGDGGLDCLGLMVKAYTVIGEHLGEPEAWRFPIPTGYPYPEALPDGSWIPEDAVADWARHWRPLREPVFGCAVTLNIDHVGVAILPAAGPGFDILHTHRAAGTVLHPLHRLARWATGYYVLRPEPAP